MESRIIIITKCGECPYLQYNLDLEYPNFGLHCQQTGIVFTDKSDERTHLLIKTHLDCTCPLEKGEIK